MLWSRRDTRPQRRANPSPPSASQKASPSGGSAAHRINNPNASSSASTPVAMSSRSPLSPLDPQSTVFSPVQPTSVDYTSPALRSRVHPSNTDMPSVELGKHIINDFGDDPAPQPVRRKSVTNQSQLTSCNLAVPPKHQPGPLPRHAVVFGSNQPDPSGLLAPSPRRPSVPSIHYQSSTTSFSASSTVVETSSTNKTMQANDEIYRDLSTYTFGAARPPAPSPSPSYDADVEFDKAISPLTPLPRKVSVDRTPRSSFVAMSHGHSSHPTQSHGSGRVVPVPPLPLPSFRSPWDLDSNGSFVPSPVRDVESSDALDSDDVYERPDLARDYETNRAHFRSFVPRGDPVQSDTASQHTFGGRGIDSSSASVSSVTSASRTHSRSSSRLDFSSDEDTGYMYRAGRASLPAYPSTDTPPDIVDDEEEIDVGLGHMTSQDPLCRRGSLPLPIPSATSANRCSLLGDDRDSNLASHRRPSRSLDDDLNLSSFADPPMAIGPRSEPSTKGDWANLQLQNQEQSGVDSDPLAGLNLGYILGGQDVSGLRRTSDVPSYVQPVRKGSQGSQIFPFGLGWNGITRRSSTATTISGPDDTFLRHLNKYNEGYGIQISYWTFKKEKADGLSRPWAGSGGFPSPRGSFSDVQRLTHEGRSKAKEKPSSTNLGMAPGTQEIWKCEYVGRFKVDRQTYRPDPTKPPQQRVNIRHILDPYSRANTRGGPSVTIHKHSRAIAFSIYRAHNLTTRRLRPGILLAPKKVQERFTSTRTTAKLATHGLLEDRNAGTPTRTSSLGRRDKDRQKPTEDILKAKSKYRVNKGSENQRNISGSKDPIRSQELSISPNDTPVSDVTNTENRPSPGDAAVSELDKDALSIDSYQRRESTSDQSTVKSLSMPKDRRDSWDIDHPPSRTPHAETYGTLDSSIIQYVRTRPDRLMELESQPSFLKRLLRPLPRSNMQTSGHTAGLTSAQLEGNYRPPWLAMAPRARQEETDRVIFNLNNSFKDVGLLPASSKPTLKSKKSVRSRAYTRVDILEHVPEESLYMLLPLWPGETDSFSLSALNSPILNAPALEERHYLLVYYVPHPEKPKEGQQPGRKRSRLSQTSLSDSATPPDERSIILSEFHVCARLVCYSELRGSGVRLPSDGLSVTGSTWEAVQTIPDPTNMKGRQSDWVIALYHGRERGVELVPGGLMELGLCLPTPPRKPPLYPVREEECDETQEPLLSPMGRAAVEIAWAGCIALSSFGPT